MSDSLESHCSSRSSDQSSMSNSSRGYDRTLFIDDPPVSLECPVCKLTLRDPHLLSCCGSHICEVCIAPYKSSDQPCPACHDTDYATLLNKRVRKNVMELQVKCSNAKCPWTGELGTLIEHLEACAYVLRQCKHNCGEYIIQKDLEMHERDECEKRPVTVQIKSLTFRFTDRLQALEEKYNEEIRKLSAKLKEQEITYTKEIAQLREELNKKTIEAPPPLPNPAPVPPPFPTPPPPTSSHVSLPQWCYPLPVSAHVWPPCTFTMTNYSKHKEQDDHWFSQPFYTHPNGYKLCLRVNANGDGEGKGKFISLFLYVMKGEFDDQLKWPFYGEMTLQLLNWREDKEHIEKTLPFDESVPQEYSGRQLKFSRGKGWGYQKFTAINMLNLDNSKNTQYLHNDCLCLRVSKIFVKSF